MARMAASGTCAIDLAVRIFAVGEVGRAEQQGEVRRIDRRRLDFDQHLVRAGRGQFFRHDFDRQQPVAGEGGDNLAAHRSTSIRPPG